MTPEMIRDKFDAVARAAQEGILELAQALSLADLDDIVLGFEDRASMETNKVEVPVMGGGTIEMETLSQDIVRVAVTSTAAVTTLAAIRSLAQVEFAAVAMCAAAMPESD